MHRVKSSFCLIQEELNNLTKPPFTLTKKKKSHQTNPGILSQYSLMPQTLHSSLLLQEEERLTLAIAFRERKLQAICFQLCNLPTLSTPWMKLLEKLCF